MLKKNGIFKSLNRESTFDADEFDGILILLLVSQFAKKSWYVDDRDGNKNYCLIVA